MNFRTLFASAAALVAIAAAADAQAAITATQSASATIVAPTSVQGTQSLAFGTIAKPSNNSSQTVTVGADTSVTTPTLGTGGNGYVTQSGQARPALFHLTGEANKTISATASLSFGAADGSLSPVALLPTTLPALDASGVADLPVGGQITISKDTAVQTYNGVLTVNVTFN